jgi:uncharacterized protein YjiS (DUF1127 family)
MDSSRRSNASFRPRSASRDCGGLRAVSALTSLRTAAASGNCDRGKSQQLFWVTQLWRWCARCAARSRERQALARLGDRYLKDIGLTWEQANAEARKPFWK